MTQTHYETLGVPQAATPEEIKKARNRMIRLNPPERNPEEFKRIDLAFKTLSDPAARADYDAQLTHGPELQRLDAEAAALFEKEDWAGAARLYKKLVVLNPASRGDWNMLGICHTRAGSWADAKKAYERLVREAADSSLYWINYAYVYINEAEDLPLDSAGRRPLLAEARGRLQKALGIAPDDADIRRLFARTHNGERDYPKAIEWLEKAIAVEGATPNPETYYLLAQVMNLSGKPEGVTKVADRLLRALPADPEARSAAGRAFARPAVDLFEAHVFGPALLYMKAAARIAPKDEQIRKVLAEWTKAQEAADEYDVMAKDPVVIPPIRFWLAMLSDEARNLEIDEPRDKLFAQINEALKTYSSSQISAAARQVRVKYPALHRLNPEELNKLERPGSAPAPASPSSSGCFVVTATFGSPHEAIVQDYRRFRDEYLTRGRAGRALIRLYRHVGPGLAWLVRRSPQLRRASAAVLGRLARHLPGATSRVEGRDSASSDPLG